MILLLSAAETIVVQTPGPDLVTLTIAALGVALAVVSLAWQAHTFLASGSRLRVEIRPGATGAGTVVTFKQPPTANEAELLQSQGLTRPVVAIRVNNRGRGSTSVTAIEIVFDDGASVQETTMQPPLPFRLEGEHEQDW